jgi:hypothetical protein
LANKIGSSVYLLLAHNYTNENEYAFVLIKHGEKVASFVTTIMTTQKGNPIVQKKISFQRAATEEKRRCYEVL